MPGVEDANRPRPPRRRRLSRRGRIGVGIAVVAITVLFMSLRGIASFYTDYLWYDAVQLSSVWRGVLGAKVALGAIFTGVFFALLWINLLIADRLAPRFRPSGPEEELLERYYEVVGRRSGLIRFVVAGLFALIAGAGVSQQWNSWVLFTNRVDFGRADPVYGLDVGFYVFQLPFLSFVVNWLFASFIIIFFITAVAHYLNGGIRVQTPAQRVTAQVKAHISVLLGVLALIKAGEYWLQRYELTGSTRGFVDGAGYADLNAKLPALNLLIAISVLSVVLFLFNIKRRGWTLPAVGVGLWAFSAIAAGSAYPWFVQRFVVEARGESAKEQPYIERNIQATREAYGMATIDERAFSAEAELTADDLRGAAEAGVFRNVQLLDPDIEGEVFNRQQAQLGYYAFPDVLDVDRYMVDGQETATLIGARELNEVGIPQKSWEGQRLIFTHGFGLVLAASGEVNGGEPAYLTGGVGEQLFADDDRVDVSVDQPRLYYSESQSNYVIVNNERPEQAFDGDEFNYDGIGGVRMSSLARRMAFALRFGDLNPLVSSYVDTDSRVMWVRDVRSRVEAAAPFLSFDGDPYPVLADGGVVYVIDGYTTSSSYPYSQRFGGENQPDDSGLRGSFNYVRNSVKATVDAFDGTVRLYLNPQADGTIEPIVRGYQKAFPALFSPISEMPAPVRDHLRHPADLFRAQTTMFGLYHVQDPIAFYNQGDRWAVADRPDTNVSGLVNRAPVTTPSTLLPGAAENVTLSGNANGERVPPQYQLLRLPQAEDKEFVITRPFVPISDRDGQRREEMTAFMAGKPDGSLAVYRVTSSDVPGPTLLTSNIFADNEISRSITLLANPTTGSSVRLGNRVMLPIGDSLLWVTPLYVSASASSSSSVPQLNSVIVSYNGRLVIAPNLASALTDLFGESVDFGTLGTNAPPPVAPGGTTTTPPGGTPGTTTPVPGTATPPTTPPGGDGGTTVPTVPSTSPPASAQTNEAVLEQVQRLLTEADEALRRGDLGDFQRLVEEAQALIDSQVIRNTPTTTEPGQA